MSISARRLGSTFGAIALVGVGFVLGQVRSQPLGAQGVKQAAATAEADKRVVAYVYGNAAISREEFGEYLINLYGEDRVRLYVNRRIIEAAAAKRKIVVTVEEVDAVIEDDCGKLSMKKSEFVHRVLKEKYGKTLTEWREDVIRPRLMLQAMCKDRVQPTEPELQKIFENLYGEKVQCQIILWPKGDEKAAFRAYPTIRASAKDFDDAARNQASGDLAGRLGYVDPIGRNSGPGTAKIEEIAFSIKDGQLSELIDTPGGMLVIKRVKSIPAQANVTFAGVRDALVKEYIDRQMQIEIPKLFNELNAEAKPLFIISPKDASAQEKEEQSKRILGVDPAKAPASK